MPLYRVTVEYEFVVFADSEKEAVKEADWNTKHEWDDPPVDVHAREIKDIKDLPEGYDGSCYPWRTDGDKMISEFFE